MGAPPSGSPRRGSAFPSGQKPGFSPCERAQSRRKVREPQGPLAGSRREMLNPDAGRFLDHCPPHAGPGHRVWRDRTDGVARPFPKASDGAGSPRPASVPPPAGKRPLGKLVAPRLPVDTAGPSTLESRVEKVSFPWGLPGAPPHSNLHSRLGVCFLGLGVWLVGGSRRFEQFGIRQDVGLARSRTTENYPPRMESFFLP